MNLESQQSDKFQILSLDGGGIRGMFVAKFLAEMESRCQTRVVDHFDLIVGTSTGGIIALGLASGMTAAEVLDFYKNHARRIFYPNHFHFLDFLPFLSRLKLRALQGIFVRKFPNSYLQEALVSALGKTVTLGDSTKRLVIPTFDLHSNGVKLFKTAHHERLKSDHRELMWKVAMATSAAPTYFSPFVVNDRMLADGGLWANNPSMVGITEAMSMIGQPLEAIKMLSIGTLEESRASGKLMRNLGMPQARAVLNSMMAGQSVSAHVQAKLLLGNERYYRINSSAPGCSYALDDVNRTDELLGLGARMAEHESDEVARRFFDHSAPEFKPIYCANVGSIDADRI